MVGQTFQQMRDKADAITATTQRIIDCERVASDAKVARLKALRLARLTETPCGNGNS